MLDLSDRLLVKEQPEIDKELIKYIYFLFEEKVKGNIYIYSKDKLKVVVAEQKNFTVDPNFLQSSLTFDISEMGSTGTNSYVRKKDYLVNFKPSFGIGLDSLYSAATLNKNPDQFFGSDIWKYFSQNLEYDLIKGQNVKNFLFVFTDGYFDFENYKNQKRVKNRYSNSSFLRDLRLQNDRWESVFEKGDYGILPVKKTFDNMDVMVLEVNPKTDFFDEYNMLEKMWSKWLCEMKVGHEVVLKKNRIETTKSQIKSFIENN